MKRFLLKGFILSILISTIAVGCKEDCNCSADATTGILKLDIELYNGATPMAWDEIVAVDNVNEYKMEFFQFYLSNLRALNGNGEVVNIASVLLADASNPDKMTFTFQVPVGMYEKLGAGIGLDATLNASDPINFKPEEPLSSAQGMYWSWAMKYRFVLINGRASKSGSIGDTNNILVAYHPGADEFYSERKFKKPFILKQGETTVYKLKLDVAQFFNGPGGVIDVETEPQTHTTPTDYNLAKKFMENFAAAFEPM